MPWDRLGVLFDLIGAGRTADDVANFGLCREPPNSQFEQRMATFTGELVETFEKREVGRRLPCESDQLRF